MSSSEGPRPTTVDEANAALATHDAEARRLAVRALNEAPADVARAVLRRVLSDEDWRVRKEGVHLAHAVSERIDVVPTLIDAFRAPGEEVALRNAAVEALASIGAPAAEAVESVLADAAHPLDADGRKLAIEVLAAARLPRSLNVVIRAAEDEDPNVRAAATEAIGAIGGEAAIPALLSILDRASSSGEGLLLRLTALEGLNRLGAEVPFARLKPFVGDKILRHAAIAALARSRSAGAFVPLVESMGDPSRHVAETAMRAFGALHRELPEAEEARLAVSSIDPRARDRVVAAARSEDVALRRGALAVLSIVADAPAIELLVRALGDADVADEVEEILLSHADRSLPRLADAARAEPRDVRIGALRLVARFADRPEAMEAMRAALRDADSEIVAAAAMAFASSFSSGVAPSDDDVRQLLRAASRKEPRVASTALQALRSLARRRRDSVRALLDDIDAAGEEAPIGCALLAVIGNDFPPAPGAQSRGATGAVMEGAQSRGATGAVMEVPLAPGAQSRGATGAVMEVPLAPGAQSRGATGAVSDSVQWLSRAISAESARTRRAAVEALGAIGGAAAARTVALAVTDEVTDVALAAIRALGRIREGRDAPGLPALLRIVSSTPTHGDDAALLAAAVRAIGATESHEAAPSLRPLVSSENPAISCAALEALADLGVDDLPELAFAALSHPSVLVVRSALDVVDAIVAQPHARFSSANDREALSPKLVAEVSTALDHASWEVRRRAAEILPRLAFGAWASTVRPLLAERAASETEDTVRDAMDRALAEIEARMGLRSVPPQSPTRSTASTASAGSTRSKREGER